MSLLKEQMKIISAELVHRIDSDSKIFKRFPTSLFFGWREKDPGGTHSRAITFPTLPSNLETDRLDAIQIIYKVKRN
jgi:hypothetical protein